MTSFVLKESGREFAADALNCFHFYKDVPRMFDAWDIDSNYREQELEGAFDVCTELVSDGIEAVIKVWKFFIYTVYSSGKGQQTSRI